MGDGVCLYYKPASAGLVRAGLAAHNERVGRGLIT